MVEPKFDVVRYNSTSDFISQNSQEENNLYIYIDDSENKYRGTPIKKKKYRGRTKEKKMMMPSSGLQELAVKPS